MAHSMHEVEEMILGLCRTSPTVMIWPGLMHCLVQKHLSFLSSLAEEAVKEPTFSIAVM